MYSGKLKEIIDSSLNGNEGLTWISAVINGNGEKRIYFIPTFMKDLDILDMSKTIYVDGTDRIIKPHFSLSKINQFSIFHEPDTDNVWNLSTGIYINETIMEKIRKAQLKGVAFDKLSSLS